MITRRLASSLLLALPLLASSGHGADLPRRVLRRIPIAGEGGWDYLTADRDRHRLFVSHGTEVDVVDLGRDSVVGRIPETPGVHGIALSPETGHGFVSQGRDSTVTMFDLATLTVLRRSPVPARNPDAIVSDPASGRVFTFGGGSHNAVAIDARTDSVVGTVPLGGKPEFAVVDGGGRLFVNLEDSSAVIVLDTRSLAILGRWPLSPGEEPSGLAIDRTHHRLFAGCGNQKLVVLDTGNGHVVATAPIGDGVDAVVFDDARQFVAASCGDGTLAVLHEDTPDRYRALAPVQTERGARTCALDPATGIVYLATADFGPPPAPTPDRPHPRASIVPGTFRLLAVGN
jgi:DNA-binding beta-propeller fold protein YncE